MFRVAELRMTGRGKLSIDCARLVRRTDIADCVFAKHDGTWLGDIACILRPINQRIGKADSLLKRIAKCTVGMEKFTPRNDGQQVCKIMLIAMQRFSGRRIKKVIGQNRIDASVRITNLDVVQEMRAIIVCNDNLRQVKPVTFAGRRYN